MNVRDATGDDADAMDRVADDDIDAARLVRDRTVRVADDNGDIAGFVAFDAWRGAVHVTRLAGDAETVGALLDGPREFAANEGLSVEAVLNEDDALGDVLEAEGFEDVGAGPRFDGAPTRRYRWEP
ncbi:MULTISPECIES: hypothetical protein [Halobacterium]|uniref:hypothetical protein n=1 Tax=Halobacterium TaxID=2239 RepID=UPI00073F424E|nr:MULTISPECIES: hypothetical protein [Halobacterium]MCG1004511.1 hypothetical protein [Halobacterium noricense]